MPRIALLFFMMMLTRIGYAQETTIKTHSLGGGIVETYHVLNADQSLKQGTYTMATRKNVTIATGTYKQGKRVGQWTFYDGKGSVQEVFDYTANNLSFEAPPESGTDYLSYSFDQKTTRSDTLTKPAKIGGTYFGYMPFMRYFKIDATSNYSSYPKNAFLQMHVGANGNLLECKLVLKLKRDGSVLDAYILNMDLLDDYDKQFLPATINHKLVTATISLLVKINPDWTVSLY